MAKRQGVTPRRTRPRLLVGLVLAVVAAALLPGSADAGGPRLAGPGAPIRPGVNVVVSGSLCTSNFVFRQRIAGQSDRLYLGLAAHCVAEGDTVDGCARENVAVPEGTRADIRGDDGRTYVGQVEYVSWRTMQQRNERNSSRCEGNDFALIRILEGDVHARVPVLGGPTSIGRGPLRFGDLVQSYQNTSLRLGLEPLKPKVGTAVTTQSGGWSHLVYTATPGIPGDSGSGLMDEHGRARGVASTIVLAPYTGANYFADLHLAVEYMKATTAPWDGLELVPGGPPTL